jgi:hypothetical protein
MDNQDQPTLEQGVQLQTDVDKLKNQRVYQQDIVPGAIKPKHLTPSTTQAKGDTYYSDGTNFIKTAIGSASQVLTVTGSVPTWKTPNISNQFPTVTAVSGTTPTLTCTGNNNIIFTITLSGNTTYSISGAQAGQVIMVEVQQGSGTTYTNTWFSGITWVTSGATAPVQTTTSGGITTYGFRVLSSSTFLGYLVGSS